LLKRLCTATEVGQNKDNYTR